MNHQKNKRMFRFVGSISINYFNLLPKCQLANYDNVFSIYIGFLFLHGEIIYVKKDWRAQNG